SHHAAQSRGAPFFAFGGDKPVSLTQSRKIGSGTGESSASGFPHRNGFTRPRALTSRRARSTSASSRVGNAASRAVPSASHQPPPPVGRQFSRDTTKTDFLRATNCSSSLPVPALPRPVAHRVEHLHHIREQLQVDRRGERLQVHVEFALSCGTCQCAWN